MAGNGPGRGRLSPSNCAYMLKNYLKVAFRNLWKNKGFSFINIVGLAIGMASAILILLWIQNEVGYDGFHEKRDRMDEARNRAAFRGDLHSGSPTPTVLAAPRHA